MAARIRSKFSGSTAMPTVIAKISGLGWRVRNQLSGTKLSRTRASTEPIRSRAALGKNGRGKITRCNADQGRKVSGSAPNCRITGRYRAARAW